jgi:hypothetical protein
MEGWTNQGELQAAEDHELGLEELFDSSGSKRKGISRERMF